MSDTMRAALDAAWDAQEKGTEAPTETEAPIEAPVAEPTEAVEPEPQEAAPEETAEATAQRARDASGRFAPKEAAPAAAAKPAGKAPAAPATPAAQVPGSPAEPAERAPPNWSPIAREHWKVLPREVKNQILRREGEMSRALTESAKDRQVAASFERAITPYKGAIQGDPVQVAESLFRTAFQLQTAPPQHKAALVAQIINSYGVPLEAINAALDGKAPPAQPQGSPGEFRDPRFDAYLAAQQQQEDAAIQQTLQEFSASNEFFKDVEPTMEGLLRGGTVRARDIAGRLEEAYSQALAIHYKDKKSPVGEVLRQREAQEQVKRQSVSAARARQAGLSVQSQGAAPSGGKPTNVREELSQRWDEALSRAR